MYKLLKFYYNNIFNLVPEALWSFITTAGIVIVGIAGFCILYLLCCKKTRMAIAPQITNAKPNITHKLLEVKLKLAKQYVALGDKDSAISLLNSIIKTNVEPFVVTAQAQLRLIAP
ncbi:MAG: hypothetical protein COC15_03655 [Legionellales bacterium]|nr:MAG: hypothetical protein COC15_03655 [Legionellales bacterium]